MSASNRPEPDTFDALMRELPVERFFTTDRARSTARAVTDSPATLAYRRRVLNEALDDVRELASVVPIRRGRAA